MWFDNIYLMDQYEGAANEGGKGPTLWNAFIQKYPCKHSLILLLYIYFSIYIILPHN